jgi:hypothetical protein
MVARTQPQSKFTVALIRAGEVLDARTVPTGERALKIAILLLAQLDDLEDGDRLTVTDGER